MGQFFSDSVERALKYIYYDLRSQRGAEGFRLLEQAVDAGDADACCLLARCLYGPEYTWPGHRFPTDEKAGDELMRRSVLEGSAIGTLLSLRCGVMNRQLAQAMPLSFQEAFDIVLDKAEHGEPLCQMIIGNAYYWGDFPEIQGKAREDFDSDDAVQSYLRENYAKCEDWMWRSLRSGISTGGVNLANFYREGKAGLISPRPEKAIEVYRYGAEKGYPSYFFYYANELYDQGEKGEAFEFYRRAAETGEPRAFFWAGYSYELGDGVPKDAARAAQYYQQALEAPIHEKVNPANRMGMCYYDGRGVERDYAKLVRSGAGTGSEGAGLHRAQTLWRRCGQVPGGRAGGGDPRPGGAAHQHHHHPPRGRLFAGERGRTPCLPGSLRNWGASAPYAGDSTRRYCPLRRRISCLT